VVADYEDFEPNRVKHLEMIQAVVSRLGSNGFLIKGWAVTLAGAFVGLAVNSHNGAFARIGAGVVMVLWGLDAYFLRAERRFRRLGSCVQAFDGSLSPFFMGATSSDFFSKLTEGKWKLRWLGTFLSLTLFLFYGVLVGAELIAVGSV
jgi:hypothetical protein